MKKTPFRDRLKAFLKLAAGVTVKVALYKLGIWLCEQL